MIINAIWRKSDEIERTDWSIRFSVCGPKIIPVIIIPRSGGSLIFEN